MAESHSISTAHYFLCPQPNLSALLWQAKLPTATVHPMSDDAARHGSTAWQHGQGPFKGLGQACNYCMCRGVMHSCVLLTCVCVCEHHDGLLPGSLAQCSCDVGQQTHLTKAGPGGIKPVGQDMVQKTLCEMLATGVSRWKLTLANHSSCARHQPHAGGITAQIYSVTWLFINLVDGAP